MTLKRQERLSLLLTYEEAICLNLILEAGMSAFRRQLKKPGRSREQQAFGKAVLQAIKNLRRRLKKLKFA